MLECDVPPLQTIVAAMLAMVQHAPLTRSLLATRVPEPHHPYLGAGSVISLRAAEPDGRVVVASSPMRLPQMHKYSSRDLRSSAAEAGASAQRHTEGASGRRWDRSRAMPSSPPSSMARSARVAQRLLPLPAYRPRRDKCCEAVVTVPEGSRRLFGVTLGRCAMGRQG
jgi:hypothetical protein